MFVEAIKQNTKYTKQLRTISRKFDSEEVSRGAASLIVVNDDGWLLTCRHVAAQIRAAEQLGRKYVAYRNELKMNPANKDAIVKKYGYKPDMVVQVKNQFFNVFKGAPEKIRVFIHRHYDIALIKIEGDIEMMCDTFPVFAPTPVESGMQLCKLGFPFAAYTCIAYDKEKDDIVFTKEGQVHTPYFPLDGMVTRRIGKDKKVFAFEMSSPGLRGQSGGPVFDTDGTVHGMQSVTTHLDLDFKMKKRTSIEGVTSKQTEHGFLNVGIAIASTELIAFMEKHQVRFEQKPYVV